MLKSFYLFIIVNLCLLKCKGKVNYCSQVYIMPILSERFLRAYTNTGIPLEFGPFIEKCIYQASGIRNNLVNFNVSSGKTSICQSSNISLCVEEYRSASIGILKQNYKYNIRQQFEDQIKKDEKQGCLNNNSIALIFTDITCEMFEMYPDMEEMFGINGFQDTLEFLENKTLQVYFSWMINSRRHRFLDFLQDGICSHMKHLKFENNENYLEAHRIIYEKLNKTRYSYGSFCAYKMPPKREPWSPKSGKKIPQTAIIIACSIVFVLILLWGVFWSTRVWRRWKEAKIEAFADNHSKGTKHLLFGNYQDEFEVTPKELKVNFYTILGQGAFGVVYKGHLKKKRNEELIEMDVAVKFVHEGANEKTRQNMLEEISFMKALGRHDNLLTMVGYVKSIENPVICTVYCSNADLLSVLKKHKLHFLSKQKCEEVKICLLLQDLLRLAIEVCSGLVYLSSLNYVHRDVAARNVLLTDTLSAKLSDFGLCRRLGEHEICIIDRNGKFPVKHLPYESLKFAEFSTKTDVWSFGILIFEMVSGGNKPFDNIPIEEFVGHLEADGKPQLPEETPQILSQLLNDKIFQKYPSRRSNFNELKQELSNCYQVILSVVGQDTEM